MSHFDEFWNRAASAAQTAASATKRAANSAKLSIAIAAEEEKVKSAYQAIGKLYYQDRCRPSAHWGASQPAGRDPTPCRLWRGQRFCRFGRIVWVRADLLPGLGNACSSRPACSPHWKERACSVQWRDCMGSMKVKKLCHGYACLQQVDRLLFFGKMAQNHAFFFKGHRV